MDNSTEGVTLLNGFLFDVLHEYESMRRLCRPAFEMAAGLDPARTDAWCPIDVYNKICEWIEQNIGSASIRDAGRAIGKRAYDAIIANGKLASPTPLAIMEALCWAASNMIRDPKGRGWQIASASDGAIVMRRTQTFNCVLQEGLLLSLIERTGVLMPAVAHAACTRRGDPHCEYRLTWLSKKK